MPPPRNLTHYQIGTNGFIFGAQGGLRVSAVELIKILMMEQNGGTYNGTKLFNPETIYVLHQAQWVYNGSNGEIDGGLFQSWGLGT